MGGCNGRQGAMGARMGLGATRDWAGGSGNYGGEGLKLWGANVGAGRWGLGGVGSCAFSLPPCQTPCHIRQGSPLSWALGTCPVPSPGRENNWAAPGLAPPSAPILAALLGAVPARSKGVGQWGWLCWGVPGDGVELCRAGGWGGVVCMPVLRDGQDKGLILRLHGSCPAASSCPSALPRRDPPLFPRRLMELRADGEGGGGRCGPCC